VLAKTSYRCGTRRDIWLAPTKVCARSTVQTDRVTRELTSSCISICRYRKQGEQLGSLRLALCYVQSGACSCHVRSTLAHACDAGSAWPHKVPSSSLASGALSCLRFERQTDRLVQIEPPVTLHTICSPRLSTPLRAYLDLETSSLVPSECHSNSRCPFGQIPLLMLTMQTG